MEKIRLTRHAQRRMKWRKISLKEVKETLTYPNRREKLPNGKVNAFKSIGAKLIRVTYLEKESRMIVMSVVDKNR